MSRYLCTFSGHRGDILWSLPTARKIAEWVNQTVDFGIMPEFKDMVPLIQAQSYIDVAFAIDGWDCTGAPHGCQPWKPPQYIEAQYGASWHLTYRAHPGINDVALPLIDYVAHQQGIKFHGSPLPFLQAPVVHNLQKPYVAFGFNEQYRREKTAFLELLMHMCPGIDFIDTTRQPWLDAVDLIKHALIFVGCRSSNYVLAHGVGQQVITFEPHPSRNAHGHLGAIFGCPYGVEYSEPFNQPLDLQAAHAAQIINQKKKEYDDAHATTQSRRSSGSANNPAAQDALRAKAGQKR